VRARVFDEHDDPALVRAAIVHLDPWLREAAASRADLSPGGILALSRDPEPRVRRRIAEHASAPARILTRLGRDRNPGVQKAARAHPRWVPGWWERFAG